MPVLSSPKVMDDLVKWEADARFCRDGGTIQNDTGADLPAEYDDPVGYPVASDGAGGYEFVEVGTEANTIGLIMQGPKIPVVANTLRTPEEYLILARGPALIDREAIATADIDGTGSLDVDAIVSALDALDIRVLTEHPEIEVQTT